MEKIKIAVIGYGNLGKGVVKSVNNANDMELVGIFSRRNPNTINSDEKVYSVNDLDGFVGKIDVCILCGGSATDLIIQGPEMASKFNTVDSFDTHAKIPEYFSKIDESAKSGNNLSIISTGWDPGLFSMNRLLSEAILPNGETYTFWGKGVSQGHGDAIRRIDGVKNAVQYTIPVDEAVNKIKNGERPILTARDKHIRECYVVAEDGADLSEIESRIVNMPNYFSDYNTYVNFITEEEFNLNHTGMPHGGTVIRTGNTSENTNQVYEFKLKLDSNPEFTAAVNVAYARAIYKMRKDGFTGGITIFDVPFSYLSKLTKEKQRKILL